MTPKETESDHFNSIQLPLEKNLVAMKLGIP
jgi:hypothetical protein